MCNLSCYSTHNYSTMPMPTFIVLHDTKYNNRRNRNKNGLNDNNVFDYAITYKKHLPS